MPQPESHLFEVMLHLKSYSLPVLDLKLPFGHQAPTFWEYASTSKISQPKQENSLCLMQAE